MIVTYNKLGFLHSYNDQPSLIDNLGNKYWNIHGKLERDGDLPCIEFINGDKRYNLEYEEYKIIRQKYNIKIEKYYNSKNKRHRLDGPAIVIFDENGNIQYEVYYVSNKLNRLDGPSIIEYYENGNIRSETYYIDDKPHRINKPAIIKYYENGNIKSEGYYFDGKKHRLYGPALITYNQNKKIINKNYYKDNVFIKETIIDKLFSIIKRL